MSLTKASIAPLSIPFTAAQLAPFVNRKPATIYKDLIRRPRTLPPAIYYGESANPLFIYVAEFLRGEDIPSETYERAERQRKAKQAKRAQKKLVSNQVQHKKVGRPSHASRGAA